MDKIKQFLDILFDENEYVCYAKHAKGTTVYKVEDYQQVTDWVQYVTINPLDGEKDNKPCQEYHAPDKPRRADCNVTSFRNIMVEIDDIPIKEQWEFINGIELPYSTAVFSGGKSIHFVISLSDSCSDRKDYQNLVRRFYKALEVCRPGLVDAANKNPSRHTRVPSVIRVETGKEQQLLKLNSRIEKQQLEQWIEDKIGPEEVEEKKEYKGTNTMSPAYLEYINNQRAKYGLEPITNTLTGFTKNFLMFGADEGERNLSVFRAACDFAKCGYDEDEAFEQISNAVDLEDQEIERTITSAFNKVENDLDD